MTCLHSLHKPLQSWGATPNKNPATALVRAGDFARKSSRMKNDFHLRLKDGFGQCVTQNVGKNNGKWDKPIRNSHCTQCVHRTCVEDEDEADVVMHHFILSPYPSRLWQLHNVQCPEGWTGKDFVDRFICPFYSSILQAICSIVLRVTNTRNFAQAISVPSS